MNSSKHFLINRLNFYTLYILLFANDTLFGTKCDCNKSNQNNNQHKSNNNRNLEKGISAKIKFISN